MAKKAIVVDLQSVCVKLAPAEYREAVLLADHSSLNAQVMAVLQKRIKDGDSIIENIEEL